MCINNVGVIFALIYCDIFLFKYFELRKIQAVYDVCQEYKCNLAWICMTILLGTWHNDIQIQVSSFSVW